MYYFNVSSRRGTAYAFVRINLTQEEVLALCKAFFDNDFSAENIVTFGLMP